MAVAKQELSALVAQRRSLELRAPRDGVIELSIGRPWPETRTVVRALERTMTLLDAEALLIEVDVPVKETLGAMHVGDRAWLHIQIPGHNEPIEGKIIHIPTAADESSQTRRVQIEASNTQNLPTGLLVRVSFRPPAVTPP